MDAKLGVLLCWQFGPTRRRFKVSWRSMPPDLLYTHAYTCATQAFLPDNFASIITGVEEGNQKSKYIDKWMQSQVYSYVGSLHGLRMKSEDFHWETCHQISLLTYTHLCNPGFLACKT